MERPCEAILTGVLEPSEAPADRTAAEELIRDGLSTGALVLSASGCSDEPSRQKVKDLAVRRAAEALLSDSGEASDAPRQLEIRADLSIG